MARQWRELDRGAPENSSASGGAGPTRPKQPILPPIRETASTIPWLLKFLLQHAHSASGPVRTKEHSVPPRSYALRAEPAGQAGDRAEDKQLHTARFRTNCDGNPVVSVGVGVIGEQMVRRAKEKVSRSCRDFDIYESFDRKILGYVRRQVPKVGRRSVNIRSDLDRPRYPVEYLTV